MAIDLNMDLSALIKKAFGGPEASLGDYTKPIAISSATILAAALYVVLVALPQSEENTAMEVKAQSIEALRNEQTHLGKKKIKMTADLSQEIDRNKQLTSRFNTEQEIEAFYDNLGQLAIQNGLTINGLKRGADIPVYNADPLPTTNTAAAPPPPDSAPKRKALIHKMPFELELSGSFMGYYRFLGALTRFQKQVQINTLNVSLIPNDRRGRVKIQAKLSAISWVPPTRPAPIIRAPAPTLQPPAAPAIPPPNAGQHGMLHRANLNMSSDRPDSSGFVLVAAKALHSTDKPSPIQQKATTPTEILPPPLPQDPDRDPFVRSDSPSPSGQPMATPNPGAPNPSNIEAYMVSGIIIGPQGRVALVESPTGESLIVKVGNPLGSRKAKVIEITESKIVVQEGKRKVHLPILSISPSTAKETPNVAQNPQNP